MTVTTNNASVEAANELDRIANVLTSYDVAPKVGSDEGADGWMPGDPLHKKPRKGWPGEQWTRPMFELLEDASEHDRLASYDEEMDEFYSYFWEPTCRDCEVSWEGYGPCWVCGVQPVARKSYAQLAERLIRESQQGAVWAPTASAGTHVPRVVFVPHIEDVNAPSVAEIAAAEPVPGLTSASIELRRLIDSGSVSHRGTITGRQLRTEPSALDEMMTAAMMPAVTDSQRFFLDRWVTGRDPRWETVSGGVTYDDLRPGTPRLTLELEHGGERFGYTFYINRDQDFAHAMRQAVKQIDMRMAYSAFRPRHVEGMSDA